MPFIVIFVINIYIHFLTVMMPHCLNRKGCCPLNCSLINQTNCCATFGNTCGKESGNVRVLFLQLCSCVHHCSLLTPHSSWTLLVSKMCQKRLLTHQRAHKHTTETKAASEPELFITQHVKETDRGPIEVVKIK